MSLLTLTPSVPIVVTPYRPSRGNVLNGCSLSHHHQLASCVLNAIAEEIEVTNYISKITIY